MTTLLARLGSPERQVPALHVAGTRGKGSTCALAAAALEAAGHHVGLTTSPHLLAPTERIRIGGRDVSETALLDLAGAVREAGAGLAPSFFETMAAAALLAFAEARVDVAVVEVGLGGRLDATNLVHPLTCAITRLGLDHADRLGGTRRAVALEKAGILKPGVRAVLGWNGAEATAAVVDRAREVGAPLRILGAADVDAAPATRLPGAVQRENAATAAAALEELAHAAPGLRVTAAQRDAAFQAVRWRARLEVVETPRAPADVLVDVAHDADSVAALCAYLRELGRPVPAAVFTCLHGKDLASMARLMRDSVLRGATLLVPEVEALRAREAGEVAAALKAEGFRAWPVDDVAAGLALAFDAAAGPTAPAPGGRPLVAAFGSFTVAEGALRALEADAGAPG